MCFWINQCEPQQYYRVNIEPSNISSFNGFQRELTWKPNRFHGKKSCFLLQTTTNPHVFLLFKAQEWCKDEKRLALRGNASVARVHTSSPSPHGETSKARCVCIRVYPVYQKCASINICWSIYWILLNVIEYYYVYKKCTPILNIIEYCQPYLQTYVCVCTSDFFWIDSHLEDDLKPRSVYLGSQRAQLFPQDAFRPPCHASPKQVSKDPKRWGGGTIEMGRHGPFGDLKLTQPGYGD